jgi:pyruvate dehydrogenase E2 component (dihydrolipoamide acetyltransferase)
LEAVAVALAEYPEFNAHFEDGEHIRYAEQNVAFAVDTEDGLVTPVIPSVTEKDLATVNTARRELTDRALDR